MADKRNWVVLRKKILKEAYPSFVQKGYAKTRVNDLARRLKMKPTTLRQVFPSKKVLFRELFGFEREKVRREVRSILEQANTADPHAVARALRNVFHNILKNEFLGMIYRYDDFPVWYCIESLAKGSGVIDIESPIERFIRDAQCSGTIREGDPVMLAHSFRMMMSLALREPGLKHEPNDSFDLLIEIFIDGMRHAPDK